MAKTRTKQRRRWTKPAKPYTLMTTDELAEATREFDEPFVWERTKPLTAKDHRLFAQAEKRGRRKIGQGAKVISLSVEQGLLFRANAYAKEHGMTRAKLFAVGLELAMTKH